MNSRKVDYFFDYVSAYSYLVNGQVAKIEGAEVQYRPMLLGAVMQATGNSPPGTVKAKGKYLLTDLKRWANRYGIPIHFNSIFPQNTMYALRAAIAAQRRGVFHEIHQAFFDAMFVHDLDLNDRDVLRKIISAAGLDADELMSDIENQSIKDELKENTEEAIRRGVFGAPTFFVGDEMFFGNDRLDFVREALECED